MGLAGITFYNAMDGCWYQLVNSDNDWEHQPRKKDGTFTYKAGGEYSKATNTADIKELGKEYTGVKGKDAVDLLMKEKQGFVRDAFHRDDIGDIALAWGVAGKPKTKKGFGLAHIIRRRTELHQDLERVLSEMQNVIENGKIIPEKYGRYKIVLDDLSAIIDPKYKKDGNKYDFQFVITAFEKDKK